MPYNKVNNNKMKNLIIILLLISNVTLGFTKLEISKKAKQADSLINISVDKRKTGMYDAAIVILMRVVEIADSFNLQKHKYSVYQSLSTIFMYKNEYKKSLDYANLALKVSISLNNSYMIGWSFARIANTNLETNNYEEAELNYRKSIINFEKIKDQKSKSVIINNLGLFYKKTKRYEEAEALYLEAYKVSKAINYIDLKAYIEMELGDLYRVEKKYEKSEIYFQLALKNEKKADYILLTESLYDNMHKLYKETGNYSKSLFYFEKYVHLTDSLNTINQDQRVLDTETKFRTNEKEKEISFLSKESELQQAQIKKGNIILALSCLVILVVIGLIVFVQVARKKQTKANNALAQKNTEIEHQKKEIVDSINYAKRIQTASLGSPDKIKDLYKNSAILFQPKDILSGDFYWFVKKENKFMFSAVDCTGHGVPGAMMSMIGNNGLNDAVNAKNLTKPSEILNHLSQYVNTNFIKTGEDVKDGMDIAFCSLDIETGVLNYAGALNSLYICKNDGEFIEVKANKNYIGQLDSIYDEHTIQLEKGDSIYVLSDGYVDQFGGEKGKKFKISNFKELIKNIHHLDADAQNKELASTINDWKQNFEQTDDICAITVKF